MAYPEPIPEIKGKDAKEFIRKLEGFDLTNEQKRFYSDAKEFHKKKSTKDRVEG